VAAHAVSTHDDEIIHVNAPERFFRGFIPGVRDIWARRELLANLVRKELKVKYKESVLGFLWALVQPLFVLMVYWLVFGKFLRNSVPFFAFYLFCGLLPWNLFGVSIGGATGSIVDNAGLIKKVYFPRELLPLASIGAGLVHFLLQLVVLFSVLEVFRYSFFGSNLLLLPLALLAEVLFMIVMGLFLAAADVYLRDTQYLLEVFLLFWFWMTPIVYPINTAYHALAPRTVLGVNLWWLYMLNPMANVVILFQRGIYKHVVVKGTTVLYAAPMTSYWKRGVAVVVCSLVLIWVAHRVFAKAQGNFAQEL
jgi:ABC-2 type transport system permease protein